MKKHLIFAVLIAVLLVLVAAVALADETMWVYTKNGDIVRVRSSMSTKDKSNIIGYLRYGDPVTVYDRNFNGWALVEFDGYGDAYIMSRFLISYEPAPYTPLPGPGKKDDPSKKTEDTDTKNASTIQQMNSLVKAVKFVEPYTVTVRPTRASGWVYLRWFPSRSSEAVATFNSNYQLTVIAELKDWYQVQDPKDGRTGFVYKSYIVK